MMRKFGCQKAFTLLEMLVVTMLLLIMLGVAIPGVGGLLSMDPLKKSAISIGAGIQKARSQGAASGNGCTLIIDVAKKELSIVVNGTRKQKPIRLPDAITIQSVVTADNRQEDGEPLSIFVNNRGMIEPLFVQISDGDRVLGVKSSPFLAGIQIVDRPVERL